MHHIGREFLLHHTAGRRPTSRAGIIEQLGRIQNRHMDLKGWADIAYHWVAAYVNGVLYVAHGVYEGSIGTHVAHRNTGRIGISLMGNYERGRVPEGLIPALAKFIAWRAFHQGMAPCDLVIKGHKDHYHVHRKSKRYPRGKKCNNTACPGKHLYHRLAELTELVRGEMSHQDDVELVYEY